MTTKDDERQTLMDASEQREAGVAELFQFYMGVEEIYAAAAKALQDTPSAMTTNSANRG